MNPILPTIGKTLSTTGYAMYITPPPPPSPLVSNYPVLSMMLAHLVNENRQQFVDNGLNFISCKPYLSKVGPAILRHLVSNGPHCVNNRPRFLLAMDPLLSTVNYALLAFNDTDNYLQSTRDYGLSKAVTTIPGKREWTRSKGRRGQPKWGPISNLPSDRQSDEALDGFPWSQFGRMNGTHDHVNEPTGKKWP